MKKKILIFPLLILLSACNMSKESTAVPQEVSENSIVDTSYVGNIDDMDYDIGDNYTMNIMQTYDAEGALPMSEQFVQEVYTEGFRLSSGDHAYEYYYLDDKIYSVKKSQDYYTLEDSSTYKNVTPDEMRECFDIGKTLSSVNWTFEKKDDEGNCYFNTIESVEFSFASGETFVSSNMELKFEDGMLKTISADCSVGINFEPFHLDMEILNIGSTSIGHELPI